jgi:hypothetical protein
MLKQNLPRKVAVITIGLIILVTALMEYEQDFTAAHHSIVAALQWCPSSYRHGQ